MIVLPRIINTYWLASITCYIPESTQKTSLLRPRERLRNIVMSVSVCLSVCLAASPIAGKGFFFPIDNAL